PTPGQPRPPLTVERFGVAEGLPPGGGFVNDVLGTPLFFVGTDEPYVARFDVPSRRFVRDETFGHVQVDPLKIGFGFAKGENGRVYAELGEGVIVAQKRPDGTWSLDRNAF